MIIIELYPQKAQYLTNENVQLVLEIEGLEEKRSATLSVYFLNKVIKSETIMAENGITLLDIGGFEETFAGFGVGVAVQSTDCKPIYAETAFDVAERTDKLLRYGFLSDFETKDRDCEDVKNLRKFHINIIQFYDWSYRHDCLVAPTEQYTDMMGKKIDSHAIRNKIDMARKLGMKTMAYGAIYAASRNFYEQHKDWAFYTGTDKVFTFINIFYIMNIERDCPWHNHIIKEYKRAVEKMGFSGIHMDTYGFPKTAYSKYNGEDKKIYLEETFADLINDTKVELSEIEPDNYLIFNNVGNWPVEPIAKANQQAVYIEVWNPYERYHHIKQIILDAKKACENEKTVILAAYLEPFRLDTQERAGYAAFLLTAVIVSNGATHLLLGENNAVLTQGYYVDHSFLTDTQAGKIRKYYDFMIRYMNLFYNPDMKDVSMTHIGWDNYEYQCKFSNWSSYGEPDKIWVTIRESKECKTISLINLCGCREDYWNKGKEKPKKQKNLTFTVFAEEAIEGVFAASPDEESGAGVPLAFTYEYTEKGRFVTFTLPELEIWTLLYLK